EVVALNEAGGREVVIFDELSVQFAYLMCLHRYRPVLIKNLCEIARSYVETVRCDRGKVGQGARIFSTTEILDLNVGPHAVINTAASLVNGTILSEASAPTLVPDVGRLKCGRRRLYHRGRLFGNRHGQP
ncbi:MAG: DUF4954 family protein, partial [Planctomycetota bacterium]